jgi:excisionase family DNA binding protein
MSSNIRIEKTCEYCHNSFIAQKVTTRYCSHACARRYYKKRVRDEKLTKAIEKENTKKPFNPVVKEKEFLSIKEVCMLLGASRWTVYRMIDSGRLKAVKIGWKTIIERNEINKLFL